MFSSPVRIIGWNELPEAGTPFKSFNSRNEAEKYAIEQAEKNQAAYEQHCSRIEKMNDERCRIFDEHSAKELELLESIEYTLEKFLEEWRNNKEGQ